ncbi:MAG: DUF4124 domain-containing protein [Xanthomonadaceae bacterium]|nr:DUF4124 domain-containing protein [Xanthomonadaceae bacterium]
MRTALILLAMLAAPALAGAQTVWKWVDEQGVTHYSDRPMPGATKMELSVGRTGTVPPSAAPPSPTSSSRTTPTSGPRYSTIAITSPQPDETIVNTGGVVQVSVALEPALRSGHNLQLYLDGTLVEGALNATSYTLTEVPRGEHTLVAVITDQQGERLQSSEPVTFYVRQTSIANPPVGPALRNPPRPRPGRTSNKLPSTQPSYADLNGARTATVDPRTNRPPQKQR